MSALLTLVSWLAILLVSVPAAIFVVQVATAWLLERTGSLGRMVRLSATCGADAVAPAVRAVTPMTTLAALVPAHNEALGLRTTLNGFRRVLRPGDRLVVVADNCSDETAAIARDCGAEVVERFDDTLRGKSYALAAGVDHLAANPPAQVLLLDADCRIDGRFVDTMSRLCSGHDRPIQALYLMQAPAGDRRPQTGLAEFAWRIKNWVRPAGGRRLGFPCALQGSGMIFPWSQLSQARIANGNLSEDYTLGLDLVRDGFPPRFTDEALVLSEFPNSLDARSGQRRRWEHGHLDLITRTAPGLLRDALTRRSPVISLAALDLLVPPLTLLAACVVLALTVAALGAALGGDVGPLKFGAAVCIVLALALGLAWRTWGRDVMPASTLLRIPGYALGKLDLYSRYVVARERQWKRTDRN